MTPTNLPAPRRDDVARVDHAAIDQAAVDKLRAGVPENTRRAYAAGRQDWAAWCADPAVATPPYPVVPEVLVRYVTHLLEVGSYTQPVDKWGNPRSRRPLAVSSVEQRVSAISTANEEAGHGKPLLRAVRLLLRGHRRQTRTAARRGKAAPMTLPVLRALVAQAMTHRAPGDEARPSLRALRDRALVLLAFAAMTRRSDATSLRIEGMRESPGGEGLVFAIRRQKTDDEDEEVRVPYGSNADLCPVRAIRAYVTRLAEHQVTSGQLLRGVTRWDRPRAGLTGEAASEIVTRLALEAGVRVPDGYAGWSMHSARRGGATEAHRAGAGQLSVCRQGGWSPKSTVVTDYFEDVDGWTDNPMKDVL